MNEQVDSSLMTTVTTRPRGPYSLEPPQENEGITAMTSGIKNRKAIAVLGLMCVTLLTGLSALGAMRINRSCVDGSPQWPQTFPIKRNATELPTQCREGYRLSETTYVHLCSEEGRAEFYDIRKFVQFKRTATIIGIQLTVEEFELMKKIESNGGS